jgi:hypothetical protein
MDDPADDRSTSISVVHVISAPVAAVYPHPKTTHATSAAGVDCAVSPNATTAATTALVVTAHTAGARQPLVHRDVTTTAAPPRPSAIHAVTDTATDAPALTRAVRP